MRPVREGDRLRDQVEGFGLEYNRGVTIHGIKGGEGDSLK
jgi:hypothetical protein